MADRGWGSRSPKSGPRPWTGHWNLSPPQRRAAFFDSQSHSQKPDLRPSTFQSSFCDLTACLTQKPECPGATHWSIRMARPDGRLRNMNTCARAHLSNELPAMTDATLITAQGHARSAIFIEHSLWRRSNLPAFGTLTNIPLRPLASHGGGLDRKTRTTTKRASLP